MPTVVSAIGADTVKLPTAIAPMVSAPAEIACTSADESSSVLAVVFTADPRFTSHPASLGTIVTEPGVTIVPPSEIRSPTMSIPPNEPVVCSVPANATATGEPAKAVPQISIELPAEIVSPAPNVMPPTAAPPELLLVPLRKTEPLSAVSVASVLMLMPGFELLPANVGAASPDTTKSPAVARIVTVCVAPPGRKP